MDAGVGLLPAGAPQQAIGWVVPRDSRVINRLITQRGEAFFLQAIGGQMLRIDPHAGAAHVP